MSNLSKSNFHISGKSVCAVDVVWLTLRWAAWARALLTLGNTGVLLRTLAARRGAESEQAAESAHRPKRALPHFSGRGGQLSGLH